jgi:hypothetical protein
VKNVLSMILMLCAFAGMVGACGGGGGGGGAVIEPPPEVDPPTITQQPVDASIVEGQAATFDVAATGEGTLSYQWQRSVNDGATWSALSGENGTSTTTPTASLADDGDRYRCLVTNAGGSTTSNAATLTVEEQGPYAHTIAIDGVDDFTSDERFESTLPGSQGLITWDADYVYVGLEAPVVDTGTSDDWFTVYVGGAAGTTTGVAYGPQQPTLSFPAQWHVRWRADGSVFEALAWGGAAWADAGWDLTGDLAVSGTYLEMRFRRIDIGDPTMLSIHLSVVHDEATLEETTVGVPFTSFNNGLDPDYMERYVFDLLGTQPPGAYVPQP